MLSSPFDEISKLFEETSFSISILEELRSTSKIAVSSVLKQLVFDATVIEVVLGESLSQSMSILSGDSISLPTSYVYSFEQTFDKTFSKTSLMISSSSPSSIIPSFSLVCFTSRSSISLGISISCSSTASNKSPSSKPLSLSSSSSSSSPDSVPRNQSLSTLCRARLTLTLEVSSPA